MMESMSVQTAQVSALSQQIRGGAQGIKSELDRLESEVGRLRASWSGEAQNAYDDAQRRWNASLTEMQQLLERISSSTDQIAQTYTQTDKSAAGRFAG
ncbi:WXG100 family type VII secretion target [Mycetocola saprophilus]|uniref:WXG100 family type VII secretion target n=1 Tax=Mycetocola saprophilus TaxID=76636 RepID=UPI0004C142BB|nr:WXG100 family type VII secretion target [Mycetocola saprophilus]